MHALNPTSLNKSQLHGDSQQGVNSSWHWALSPNASFRLLHPTRHPELSRQMLPQLPTLHSDAPHELSMQMFLEYSSHALSTPNCGLIFFNIGRLRGEEGSSGLTTGLTGFTKKRVSLACLPAVSHISSMLKVTRNLEEKSDAPHMFWKPTDRIDLCVHGVGNRTQSHALCHWATS